MMTNYTKDIELKTCLLFFCNSGCFPCEILEKELNKLDYPIYKVNIEKDLEIAKFYNITSLPSLLFIKNGEPVYTLTGVRGIKDINKILLHFNMI